jgi:hypothetical protein
MSMAAMNGCPGSIGLRGTPALKEKICPECGGIIEIFAVEPFVKCECGFIAYNETLGCVNWCRYARDCVGEELYNQLITRKGDR